MEYMFATGQHSFLMPSEQIEELEGAVFNSFCFVEPDFSEEHIELEAWKCRWATNMLNASLYVQSNFELAKLINADGIILKRNDLPPELVRSKIGTEKRIGGMAGNFEDAVNFMIEGVDFMMLGPVKSVSDKREIGFDRLETILGMLKDNNMNIPLWVFGGILPEDIERLEKMGIRGVSVSSYILTEDEIDVKAREYNKKG
ncbi:thiamine phosphate synthase [Saccharicrinis sp. FJH62]|uniref:thiamine phosphate synthase n=1 Tax=Saccharicrinis sp. FJH62 TaxID=3344657 RepID=UPI0035D42852